VRRQGRAADDQWLDAVGIENRRHPFRRLEQALRVDHGSLLPRCFLKTLEPPVERKRHLDALLDRQLPNAVYLGSQRR
jgi:hypothetical protein